MINLDQYRADLDSQLAQVMGQSSTTGLSTNLVGNTDWRDGSADANLTEEEPEAYTGEGPAVNRNLENEEDGSPSAFPGSGAQPQNLGAGPESPAPQGNLENQPQKVPVMPDGKPLEFHEDKLKDAKSLPDFVDAMKPKSRNEYMNWYEKQYGSINQQYDHMKQQLGDKPDPDRSMSRKEKWTALMEFGINLIKSSQSKANGGQGDNLGSALAVAGGNTVAGLDARRQGEVSQFDQKQQGVESGRQSALKSIGTYGDALKGQAQIDADEARVNASIAAAEKAKRVDDTKAPDTINTDQGVFAWDATTKTFKRVTDEKGRSLTNNKVGSRGGVQPDTRPAEEKKFDHLTTLGLPRDVAMRIAYRQTSGNPVKDYKDVYRTALTANFGNEKKAKAVADSYIGFTYGEDAVAGAQQPIVPDRPGVEAPPVSALKAGQVTKFKNGQSWRLDENGKPQQVK